MCPFLLHVYIVGPFASYTDLFPTPVAAPCPFPSHFILCCLFLSFFVLSATAVAVAVSPVVCLSLSLSHHRLPFSFGSVGCALFACCLFASHSLSLSLSLSLSPPGQWQGETMDTPLKKNTISTKTSSRTKRVSRYLNSRIPAELFSKNCHVNFNFEIVLELILTSFQGSRYVDPFLRSFPGNESTSVLFFRGPKFDFGWGAQEFLLKMFYMFLVP